MRSHNRLIVWALIGGPGVYAHAQVVSIPVAVTVKVRAGEPARPFSNVGGFAVKRLNSVMDGASCPDSSDSRGRLECKIPCKRNDPNPRVTIVPPLKEDQTIVAGYSLSTRGLIVEFKNCRPQGKLPLVFNYRSYDQMLIDLEARAPNVYKAIVTAGMPDAAGNIVLRPFQDSAKTLAVLATDPKNREALEQVAEISSLYTEASAQNPPKNDSLKGYKIGVQSVFLRQKLLDARWPDPTAVPLTSDPVLLAKAAINLEKQLDQKAVLSESEIKLDSAIEKYKSSQMDNRR